jgi:hypothetical protein
VRDLAGHEKLQRLFRSGIITEINEPLVYDLRPRLCGDVAAQVHVQLAGDLQISCRPRISHRVKKIHPAVSGNGDEPGTLDHLLR